MNFVSAIVMEDLKRVEKNKNKQTLLITLFDVTFSTGTRRKFFKIILYFSSTFIVSSLMFFLIIAQFCIPCCIGILCRRHRVTS